MAPPSFCTFNRLKIACIATAFIQITVFIFFVICIISSLISRYSVRDSESINERSIINALAVLFLIMFYIVNIAFACWFIRGAILNDSTKMEYYDIILLINIVSLILHFDYYYFVTAALEFFVFVCSHSLYRQCKDLASPDPETPPPTYDSCELMKMSTAGVSSPPNSQLNSEVDPHVNPPGDFHVDHQVNPVVVPQMDPKMTP